MTHDPLDDLKAAMDAATPAPDAARRQATLARAQEIFDRAQGTETAARPTPDRQGLMAGLAQGVGKMFALLTTRLALTATTAIVAVGMIAVLPMLQKGPEPVAGLDKPEITGPAEGDAKRETAVLDRLDDRAQVEGEQREAVVMEEAAQPEMDLAGDAAPAAPPPPVVMAPAPVGSLSYEGGAVRTQEGFAAAPTLNRTTTGIIAPPPPGDDPRVQVQPDTEDFANEDQNPVKVVTEDPVSTFSIDVDTASYAVVRSSLMNGQMPPPDAVRVEEMINYFDYDYPTPEAGEGPFRPTVTVAETPWNPDTQLMTIALQGEMPAVEDRPPLNLVFLIDTSGSMNQPNKLPLLIQSFKLMLGELRPEDEVAIVTYAGSAGLVLEPTPASERDTIAAALEQLSAGGSTAGQAGLIQAYAVAEQMAEDGEIGRVILATDGDFNVGIHDPDDLKEFIEDKRDSGTYLSVLGFGRGNLHDSTMQALAQNGNGTAAYIDTLSEAQKVLVDQLTGALFPIANDVKIQVEFNPAEIAEYRLIGYETRALNREDFNNDKVDAGEIGAGHSVTAIYEITPVGSPAVRNDPLRYGSSEPVAASEDSGELAFLRLRYKEPGEDTSQLLELPIVEGMGLATVDTDFAAAIAGFAQLLKGEEKYIGDWSYDDAIALATASRGEDPFGYRSDAIKLMRLAQSVSR